MPRDTRPAVQFTPQSIPLRVFLSSTSPDLANERECALREIERINGGFPRIKTLNADGPHGDFGWWTDLQQCDVMLVLVGSGYGNIIPAREISPAEAQYRDARGNHKPCLAYIRKSDALALRRYSQGHSVERALLEEWKQTLEEQHQVRYFGTPAHFGSLVASDLRFILRALQQRWQLGRTSVISGAVEALDKVLRLPIMEADKLQQSLENLELSFDLTLEMFGEAMEWNLNQPPGRRLRVTAFAIAIGRCMELPQERVRSIARSAFLCDVGKLAIPREIRDKDELTEQERALLLRHPFLGHDLLKKVPFLRETAEVVYAMEEHYDGSGYPRGLVGELIPLGARLISVARSFEENVSDGQTARQDQIASARRSIQQNAGKQFDPRVVDVFMAVPEKIWAELIYEIDKRL